MFDYEHSSVDQLFFATEALREALQSFTVCMHYSAAILASTLSMHEFDGSSSPAGSSGPSESAMILMVPSSTNIVNRFERFGPSLATGPGWSSTMPSAFATTALGSARNVMLDPAMPMSFAHASMTWPSFTQNTITSSIPACFNASCPARKPGTWHVDHVGVNAPGSPTTKVFLPASLVGMFTSVGGNGPFCRATSGNVSPTATILLLYRRSWGSGGETRRALGAGRVLGNEGDVDRAIRKASKRAKKRID